MTGQQDPPVWLLDVDGVINASRAGWHRAPRAVQVWSASDHFSYRIRWEPHLVTAINRIHDTGLAEVRWSTTWCPDIGNLEDALRIGPFATAFCERPDHLTWAELKVHAALDALADGRRIVWTDDVEIGPARNLFPAIAEAEKTGRALLVAPHPSQGLRPEDIARIEAFCEEAP